MKKIVKTAPDALRLLWEEKFIFVAKTKSEILKELEKKGYNFDDDAIRMALKRADFITKKGEGESATFVQKYPFVEEKNDKS